MTLEHFEDSTREESGFVVEKTEFHRNSYSGRDNYCKFQGVCEYYSYSCRLEEITPSDCGYADKITRANRIMKARRLG